MQDTIVVIVDKPFVANILAPFLVSKFKDAKIFTISTMYIGLYEFEYPRGLSFSDIPRLSDPRWKPRNIPDFSPVQEIFSDRAVKLDISPTEILSKATQILFSSNMGSSGVIAFHTLISECLGAEHAKAEYKTIVTYSLAPDAIEASLKNLWSTKDSWYEQLLNTAQAKKFFDYNFNTNSLVVLGDLLRKFRVDTNQFIMSKFSLQVLYDLKERSAINIYDYAEILGQSWKGTGRYEQGQIGSATSRFTIIDELIKNSLAQVDNDNLLTISVLGKAFLDRLHPDCCDPDLPFRLQEWGENPVAAQPKMERYLNTFFGKQKKFASKNRIQEELHWSQGAMDELKEYQKLYPPFKAGSGGNS